MPELADTIAAEATPPGRGALRVLRLSGPRTLDLLGTLFVPESGSSPSGRPRTAVLGFLRGECGEPLDRCLALFFPGPASFTGEDCAELHLHGSPGLMRAALEACVRAGARVALPGEFSYRAFLAGKVTLPEAEGADALASCEAGGQARRFGPGASEALEGEVRELLEGLRDIEARMEASLDFPEEVPPGADSGGELASLAARSASLAEAGLRLRPLREGRSVALVGAPNAGKSSLFNALLRRERAIVSPHPGTTRDVLSETLEVGGMPLTLLDTAGGREAADPVERLGVEAALRAAGEADGLLFVYDGAAGWGDEDASLVRACPGELLAVLATKADLGRGPAPDLGEVPVLGTSAVTGEGLGELHDLLARWLEEALPGPGPFPMTARQAGAALAASRALGEARSALARGFTEEVALQGVREARGALEEILGGGDPESLYDRIFASFCLGK